MVRLFSGYSAGQTSQAYLHTFAQQKDSDARCCLERWRSYESANVCHPKSRRRHHRHGVGIQRGFNAGARQAHQELHPGRYAFGWVDRIQRNLEPLQHQVDRRSTNLRKTNGVGLRSACRCGKEDESGYAKLPALVRPLKVLRHHVEIIFCGVDALYFKVER